MRINRIYGGITKWYPSCEFSWYSSTQEQRPNPFSEVSILGKKTFKFVPRKIQKGKSRTDRLLEFLMCKNLFCVEVS